MKLSRLAMAAIVVFFAIINPASAQIWMAANVPTEAWSAIAYSADGTKLVVVSGVGTPGGPIYTSTNAGAAWISNNAPNLEWTSVALSSNGTVMAAAPHFQGLLYVSTNAGATWAASGTPLTNWGPVAVSPDGSTLAAADWVEGYGVTTNPSGYILVSTNKGSTWQGTHFPDASWQNMALSSNVLVARSESVIYVSTNLGNTFTINMLSVTPSCFAFSTGGTVAIAGYEQYILLSTNYGATWSGQSPVILANWVTVGASANGSSLVAVNSIGQGIPATGAGSIYTTTNSGTTWKSSSPLGGSWSLFTASADGTKWAAIGGPGNTIYVSPPVSASLAISYSGTNSIITWPASSPGPMVQQNSNLTGTNWLNTSYSATIVSNNSQITAPLTNDSMFYRLWIP